MAKDSKGHGSDERALRKEQQATYKAGRAAQAAENRKIMGPTTGKAAQNMRDLVRAKVKDGQEAAAKKQRGYHAEGGKVKAGTPSVETPAKRKSKASETPAWKKIETGFGGLPESMLKRTRAGG